MLVSAKEMLDKAKAGHYAVGQFNINNLEWTKAILLTAQENNSPVILGVSEGAGKYMCGYKTVVGMVNGMLEELNITVPVALHLDHGSYEGCMKCIEAGFSSIMFDGSHYPIEENIAKTKELVAIVKEKGMSLEAEVGSIGGEEDGVVGAGEFADPQECKMIAELGIDFLAAGIGNIHGKYPENWPGLSFETLDAIQQLTGEMPLVLHGGSGTGDDNLKKAVQTGIQKVNLCTDLSNAGLETLKGYLQIDYDHMKKDGSLGEFGNKTANMFDLSNEMRIGYKEALKHYITLFGSVNKAQQWSSLGTVHQYMKNKDKKDEF